MPLSMTRMGLSSSDLVSSYAVFAKSSAERIRGDHIVPVHWAFSGQTQAMQHCAGMPRLEDFLECFTHPVWTFHPQQRNWQLHDDCAALKKHRVNAGIKESCLESRHKHPSVRRKPSRKSFQSSPSENLTSLEHHALEGQPATPIQGSVCGPCFGPSYHHPARFTRSVLYTLVGNARR